MIYVLAAALLLTGGSYVMLAGRSGVGALARQIASALTAGVPAGVVLGISARVAMRLLALGAGATPRLTARGSSAVVVVFAGIGVLLALPYAAVLRRVVGRPAVVYAALLAVVTFQPFLRTAAQDLGAGPGDSRAVGGTVLTSLLMWVPYALALEASLRCTSRLTGATPSAVPGVRPDAGSAVPPA